MNKNPFSELASFQRDIIIVLGNMNKIVSANEISKNLAEMYDTDKIHSGRLYPNLNTVISEGFVERQLHDKRIEMYKITPKGMKALKQYNSLTDC